MKLVQKNPIHKKINKSKKKLVDCVHSKYKSI